MTLSKLDSTLDALLEIRGAKRGGDAGRKRYASTRRRKARK